MDGYVDLVDDLLAFPGDKDAVVEEEAKPKVSPLNLVIAGDVDGLEQLLKDNPDFAVNARNSKTGRALLHEACARGDMQVAKFLLQKTDVELSLRTMLGRCTALHLAVTNNYRSVVFLLLSHGADASSRDRFGCSPMHYVKSLSVAKLLIQYGAQVLDHNAVRCNYVDRRQILTANTRISGVQKKKQVVQSVISFMVSIRQDHSIPAVERDAMMEAYKTLVKYLEKQAQTEYRIKLEILRQRKMQAKAKPTGLTVAIPRLNK
ncbi:hypothetical protein PHMEG_0001142 [Phytophthora megakarya]|uniref:Uncharacterized protein n=1 Tax=Phytophthora megakarya TaxID=4795 RepID=A0A225X3I4_9STRA|nr:hypothetical protein PHMEG_0001142 [Phytophthora megakarya]